MYKRQVRGGGLLFGDHDVGFKVVHTVLALASIGLAGALHRVDREVARTVVGGLAGKGPVSRQQAT